jgi:hypothetical protein
VHVHTQDGAVVFGEGGWQLRRLSPCRLVELKRLLCAFFLMASTRLPLQQCAAGVDPASRPDTNCAHHRRCARCSR